MIFKKGMSFEFADTGPNVGQTGFDPPKQFKLPFKMKKVSGGDVDDIELGDAMRDMPRIRQIHKLGAMYHGSPRKVGVLRPRDEHGDPRVKPAVFGTPSKEFALAYAGRKWGDRDIEQSTRGGKNERMILREARPGAFEDVYGGKKGYLYTLPEEPFMVLPGRRTAKELVSYQEVRPIKTEVIPNIMTRLQKAPGVEMHQYRSDAPENRAAVKRQVKRMREMDDGGKGYLRWRLENAPPEIKQMFSEEMEKKGAAVPNQVFEAGGNKYDVQRLWDVSKKLPRKRLALSDSEDFMESRSWTGGRTPNEILSSRDDSHGHLTRIRKANLRHPVILAPNGGVVDGMHRLAKAKIQGRDTVPVRRFESWGDMKPALLEKRSSEPGHIFVTGYSGAGKSTYAKKLSEETGLPVRGLDADPEFVRLVKSRGQKVDYSPGFIRKLDAARSASVRQAVRSKEPTIFEGSQILVDPKITEGHRRILVDVPESRIVRQRVRREWSKPHKEPKRSKEDAYQVARDLIKIHRQEFRDFKKTPGVEVVRPEFSSTGRAGYHRKGKWIPPRLEKTAYKLQGHRNFQGLPIAIENRRGSVRKGTDSDGHEWRTKMKVPYGYIVGTRGADGEPVDAFVGPHEEARNAFVVHQHKPTGKGYDEDKVMLGFPSKKDAKEMYLAHYDDPKFLGPIHRVSTERLKELVASKKKLVKISQVSYRALLDEILKMAAKEGDLPKGVVAKERERLVRNAGPAVGALLGAGVGAVRGVRKGRILPNVMGGLGTGATLGWLPDIVASAGEGAKRYQKKVLAK